MATETARSHRGTPCRTGLALPYMPRLSTLADLLGKCLNQLENREIALDLVGADVHPEAVPFDLFVFQELVENMVSQGFPHQGAFFDFRDRLVQAPGQFLNPQALPLRRGQMGNVHLHRLRRAQEMYTGAS